MKQPIELRRIRDFGQVINDTFIFLKENLKPLLKVLFIICGFFILIGIISSIFTYMNITSVFSFDPNTYDGDGKSYMYFTSVFITAFALMISQAFIFLTTLCYISVYLQKDKATPTLAEVWGYFRFYFFRVLLSSILIFILLMIATVCCLVPAIWLSPILYLIFPVIVMENTSFSYAFNKSFRIIKDNWWFVFGVIFVMMIIVIVINSCVSIPLGLITVGSKFLTLTTFRLPAIIIFSILRNILLLAYVLPAIGLSLCYFALTEQKDGTGLMDRIEKLGKSDDTGPALPAEEY
jgi:hypothetical protein